MPTGNSVRSFSFRGLQDNDEWKQPATWGWAWNDIEGKGDTKSFDFETRCWLKDSMKDRDNNKSHSCIDQSTTSNRKSVAPWLGTNRQVCKSNYTEKRLGVEYYASTKRHAQKREQRQRIKDAGRQLCQVVVEERSARQQRIETTTHHSMWTESNLNSLSCSTRRVFVALKRERKNVKATRLVHETVAPFVVLLV